MIDVLLVLLLVAIVLGVIGAVALAVRSRKEFREGNEVVPGVRSPAPASWAGAHTPEARLHRRLRDAMAALRTSGDDGMGVRPQLEQAALSLDERLVAVAALAPRTREQPLADVEAAVVALEDAVAALTAGGSTAIGPGVVDEVSAHLRFLAEARAELDRLEPPQPRPGTG
jgi:hypothetical protein